MLKVDHQSGGFTPHAPLNRVHPVKFTSVTAKRISLGYLQGVQLGCNLYPARNVDINGHIEVEYFNLLKPDGTIPLGPTPWNEICPKNYLSPDIPVHPLRQNSYNLICTIPLGPAPWNLYPTCNLDKNGHIEVESFNLLNPDGSIPLGLDP
jgi:hypothetical protein